MLDRGLEKEIESIKTHLAALEQKPTTVTVEQRVVNNTTNNVSQTVNTHNVNQTFNAGGVRSPGWPARWGAAPVAASPFYPNSLPPLSEAVLKAAEQEQRSTGSESSRLASFAVALLRSIRSDPQYQNVFVSPDRADLALVKLALRWERIPLEQAKRELMEHVAVRLGEQKGDAARTQCAATAAAISGGNQELAREVGKCLSALLLWTPGDGTQMLTGSEGLAKSRGAVRRMVPDGPRDELRVNHLEDSEVVNNLENATGVWDAEDLQTRDLAEVAAAAVAAMAGLIQRGAHDNLHAVLLDANNALRYSYCEGWKSKEPAGVAAHLSWQLARVSAGCIERCAAGRRGTTLSPVASFLRERLSACDGAPATEPAPWFYEPWAMRTLARFSRIAAPRSCALETPGFRALRRLLAQFLSVDPEDEAVLAAAHRVALEEAVSACALLPPTK